MTKKIFGWACLAALSTLYLSLLVAAIGDLTQFPSFAARLDLTLSRTGWWMLWINVAMPVCAYLLAALIARGRSWSARLLVFATALATVAALRLELSLLVPPTSFLVAA